MARPRAPAVAAASVATWAPYLVVQLLLITQLQRAACAAGRGTPRRSNVVIVYADDFGFDIGGFGHPTVVTPELDRMITEGAKLTQCSHRGAICLKGQ